MKRRPRTEIRNLVLVLGDQLNADSAAFDGFDATRDRAVQMELHDEATYVPQHKRRLAFFFSAMRHFRDELEAAGRPVLYSAIDDPANAGSFSAETVRRARETAAERLVVAEPGDWRVRDALARAAGELRLPLEIRADRHFLTPADDFAAFVAEHDGLRLETFYRARRRRLDLLMDGVDPAGGRWNFDRDNRRAWPRSAAPPVPDPPRVVPDRTTRAVLDMVSRRFAHSPGSLDDFALPVTRRDALQALDDFISNRLPLFGTYQDAIAEAHPFLFHSLLSGLLNLHLLSPAEIVERAIAACDAGVAPLNAVEGFVRQIVGWREFVRGVYWHFMPGYAERNALAGDLPVPRFLWTGDTDMRCVAAAVAGLVAHAYTHHIQRLMVLGQLTLLLGVRPYDVHRWHLSMFWDAIDWVSLPNTLGMSQHGDGGLVGSKPYCASGRYIDRMSDHCRNCRYDPKQATGDDACPFTTLYWDFLARHRQRFAANRRMRYPYLALERKDEAELRLIRRRADALKRVLTAETFL